MFFLPIKVFSFRVDIHYNILYVESMAAQDTIFQTFVDDTVKVGDIITVPEKDVREATVTDGSRIHGPQRAEVVFVNAKRHWLSAKFLDLPGKPIITLWTFRKEPEPEKDEIDEIDIDNFFI